MTNRIWWLAMTVVVIGLMTLIFGSYLEQRNPRSDIEDDIAIAVLMGGMSLIGVGPALPFARPCVVVMVAVASPVVGWRLLVMAYLT